jgi:hypothetical protein
MLTGTPTLRGALVVLIAGTVCRGAHGAQWSVQPALEWQMDYDSNRRLAPSGESPNEGGLLSFDTAFKRATESTAMTLHPSIGLQRFAGDSALDANTGAIQWDFTCQRERTSLLVSTAYRRESTLTTELADTGIVDSSTRRDSIQASVEITRELAERQHLDLTASWSDVRYPDGLPFRLVGYRYPQIVAEYRFGLSERTTLSATAYADRVSAPLTGYTSDDAGIRFGASRELSMRISLYAAVGINRTAIGTQKSHGQVWHLQASRDSVLSRWTLSYDRSVQPSGYGILLRRDDVAVSLSQSVAPRLFATFTLHAVSNNSPVSGGFVDDRRYLTGDAGLEWHMSPQWVLHFTAGASEARSPNAELTARGWRTALNARWSPLDWNISR